MRWMFLVALLTACTDETKPDLSNGQTADGGNVCYDLSIEDCPKLEFCRVA